MFEDLTKSLKQQILERLSSPLLGTFVIAWSLWNYKFYVVLFSAATVTKTFDLIDTIVFPDNWTLFLRGVLYPLLTAGAYIFLYPYPARVVHGVVHRSQMRLLDDRRSIEGQTLLTLEESRRIRAEREHLQAAHDSEIDRKNKEIDRLREALAILQTTTAVATRHAQAPFPSSSPSPANAEVETETLLSQALTSSSLATYTKWKFPKLDVSEYWNDKAIRDLDADKYPTLRQIDISVKRASAAINAYHLQDPELFKFGTDFITKSLGFVDLSFRSKHPFSQGTLDAFIQYQGNISAAR